jgi:phosphate/sulfate permease
MQKLVNEKSGITDVRAAMLVNLVYTLILFYFKNVNNIPMSTTWVFIGLLGGREIAMSLARKDLNKRKKVLQQSIRFIKKDLNHAFIGLLISITLAFLVNAVIRQMMLDFLKELFK